MRKKHKPNPKLLPAMVVDYWRKCAGFPGLWDDLSSRAENQPSNICPLPIRVSYSLLLDRFNIEVAQGLSEELTAAWAWDQERVIYRFDPTLAKTLIDHTEAVAKPTMSDDFLLHLPHRCFFVEAPVMDCVGFFCWVDIDSILSIRTVRFLLLRLEGGGRFNTTAFAIRPIIEKEDIDRTITDQEFAPKKQLDPAREEGRIALAMLQLVEYLMATNAETSPASDGAILVGRLTGRKLRSNQKAYVRRAHWHHYWVGSEQRGDRHLELRWIPPTPVGAGPTTPKIIDMKTQINKNKKDSNDERG